MFINNYLFLNDLPKHQTKDQGNSYKTEKKTKRAGNIKLTKDITIRNLGRTNTKDLDDI